MFCVLLSEGSDVRIVSWVPKKAQDQRVLADFGPFSKNLPMELRRGIPSTPRFWGPGADDGACAINKAASRKGLSFRDAAFVCLWGNDSAVLLRPAAAVLVNEKGCARTEHRLHRHLTDHRGGRTLPAGKRIQEIAVSIDLLFQQFHDLLIVEHLRYIFSFSRWIEIMNPPQSVDKVYRIGNFSGTRASHPKCSSQHHFERRSSCLPRASQGTRAAAGTVTL